VGLERDDARVDLRELTVHGGEIAAQLCKLGAVVPQLAFDLAAHIAGSGGGRLGEHSLGTGGDVVLVGRPVAGSRSDEELRLLLFHIIAIGVLRTSL
jgi:hypothetical protein